MPTRYKVEHRQHGEGYITVAYNYDPVVQQLSYGLSFCSPLDQFSRKRGVLIAEGRLEAYLDDADRRDKLSTRQLAGQMHFPKEPKKQYVVNSIVEKVTKLTTYKPRQLRWISQA
jgi:hypothetical protein